MLKAIIFDCDGVLLDTLEANRSFYNAILQRLGYPPLSTADLEQAHAMTVDQAYAHVLSPKDALRAPQIAQEIIGEAGVESYSAKIKVPQFLPELLGYLKQKYFLGVVTNRNARGIGMLKQFNLYDYFDAIISSSDVVEPKPAPEGLIKICQIFKITPQQALFVGDSKADSLAANACSMPFVAYDAPHLCTPKYVKSMPALKEIIDLWV